MPCGVEEDQAGGVLDEVRVRVCRLFGDLQDGADPEVEGFVLVDLAMDVEVGQHGRYLTIEGVRFSYGDEQVMAYACESRKPIVIEKLDFRQKKAALEGESRRYSRMLSSFSYGKIKAYFISRGYRQGVEVHQVNPAFSRRLAHGRLPGASRVLLPVVRLLWRRLQAGRPRGRW